MRSTDRWFKKSPRPFADGAACRWIAPFLALAAAASVAAEDEIYGSLKTPWAADALNSQPWPEYPRPQMVRPAWVNLNGDWDYAILPRDETAPPAQWEGTIRVPFAAESQLSGVQRRVSPSQRLWYRRTFERPAGERILLHFDAVDWEATVWVNGTEIGWHRGGFDPFSFDVTGALQDGENELIVAVWDPSETGSQPRGKQVRRNRGIWYTTVTGIWQTVWLEPVPEASIERLETTPNVDDGHLAITVHGRGLSGETVRVVATEGMREVARVDGRPGQELELELAEIRLWSPDDPFLYGLEVQLVRFGEVVDAVSSYFGMRKIELGHDEQGHARMLLNGEPLFHYGFLDQGWWPDGLLTPPSDAALLFDIEQTKAMGFNTIRKHAKVAPARFYAHCDRLGILVWQDMPTAHPFSTGWVKAGRPDWDRPKESAEQFKEELEDMMQLTQPFPSVVMYVLHNEGWGQHDTIPLTKWMMDHDPSRLVNSASGWRDRRSGQIKDLHAYPGPAMEPAEENPGRAVVLGEFGGLGLSLPGHLWSDDGEKRGYGTSETPAALFDHYRYLIDGLRPMIHLGLSGAIYTQTTDVENEVNGLITYDRRVVKLPVAALRELHAGLYATDPDAPAEFILEDSELRPHIWRYTDLIPPSDEDWTALDFDDEAWKEGRAPFQNGALAPDLGTGTPWKTEKLRLRRSFTLDQTPDVLSIKVYAGSPARLWLNGRELLKLETQEAKHYEHFALPQASALLRNGKNVLAVELTAQGDQNGFDAGLYTYPAAED